MRTFRKTGPQPQKKAEPPHQMKARVPRPTPLSEQLNTRRSQGYRYFQGTYTEPLEPESEIHRSFRSSFLASVYGDSMGMPFESTSPVEILERNGGEVTKLTNPVNTFSSYLSRGGWTDDTQLKIALMESILDAGGVDMNTVAAHHMHSYSVGPRGWGGSTRESVKRLVSGVPWNVSGKSGGAGNGVAMKVGPIGALYGIRYGDTLSTPFEWETVVEGSPVNIYQKIAENVRDVSIMTHRDSRAIVSGFSQAVLVAWGLNGISLEDGWDTLLCKVRRLEKILPITDTTLSSRLEYIERYPDRDPEFYAHLFRTGCFVLESYPFTLSLYLKYANDTEKAIQAAVNAGGDCDTTASMVGELSGAYSGTFQPPDLQDLEEYQRLLGVSDEFYCYAKTGVDL